MSKPLFFSALAQFAAATAGRNMTKAAYVAVTTGFAMMLMLTVAPAYEAAPHWVDAALWACLAFFVFEWVVRLRHAYTSQRGWVYALSGRGLVDAVAASTANGFGVPPYSIGENRYIDGGYRRNENADLAAGYGRVLVLSPFGGRSRHPLEWGMHLAAQVDELRARGSNVETIFPDGNSLNAFGDNMMDLSTRPPAARAGYDQGRALAGQLTEFWR